MDFLWTSEIGHRIFTDDCVGDSHQYYLRYGHIIGTKVEAEKMM